MRSPLPTNRLVALTLVGALLTTIVAVGLVLPGFGLAESTDAGGATTQQAAAGDVPTPNQNFTPAVQTQSGGEERNEHEAAEDEGEEHDEREGSEHEGDDGAYDD
ncbi:MAG: hypothetical protein ABEI96_09075 [Haloarculaceae archaeon]